MTPASAFVARHGVALYATVNFAVYVGGALLVAWLAIRLGRRAWRTFDEGMR